MKNSLKFIFGLLPLFLMLAVVGCKKTKFTQGDEPVLDTTNNNLPPKQDPPVDPPPTDPPPTDPNSRASKYWVLDGTTNYMVVNHHSDLDIENGKSATITFWMRTTNTSSGPRIFTKRPEVAPSPGYEVNINGTGKIAINVRNVAGGNNGTPFSTGKDLRDGEWHHIACVFDQTGSNTVCTIYVDGVFEVTATAANSPATPVDLSNAVNLVIGAKSTSYTTKFNGSLDEIRFYNYPMTIAQITSDMTLIADAATPGLIASWDFEDVTGDAVRELKNTHHGKIFGAVVIQERSMRK